MMLKLVLVLALIVLVQGRPNKPTIDIEKLIEAGHIDSAQKLFSLQESDGWKSLDIGNVKNLKPVPGGHVYGESQITFEEVSTINGKKIKQSGGHKVINDDGKISEFDIKPQRYD